MLLSSRHSGRSLHRLLGARLWLPANGSEPLGCNVSKQPTLTAQHDGGATCIDSTSQVGIRHFAGAENFAPIRWLRRCSQAASESSWGSRCSDVVAQRKYGNASETAAVHAAEGGQWLQPDTGSEAHEVFVDDDAASRQNHMRFVDRLRVDVTAGHGGRGCVSFVKSATRGARKRRARRRTWTVSCSVGLTAPVLDETM